jgi:hypothetical protein
LKELIFIAQHRFFVFAGHGAAHRKSAAARFEISIDGVPRSHPSKLPGGS